MSHELFAAALVLLMVLVGLMLAAGWMPVTVGFPVLGVLFVTLVVSKTLEEQA